MDLLPDCRGNLEPTHLGQMEVEQSDVVAIVPQGLQSLLAVRRDVHVMSTLLEKKLQNLMCGGAVFGHQNSARRATLCFGFVQKGCRGCHSSSLGAFARSGCLRSLISQAISLGDHASGEGNFSWQ